MEFLMQSGITRGREHIIFGINCQDSLNTNIFVYKGNVYYTGVVTDGCGEGGRSETGAHLASSFLTHRIEHLVRTGVSAKSIPTKLFGDLLSFLKTIVDSYQPESTTPDKITAFIKEHLLFTVLGFVIGPKTSVIFALGDGITLLNDVLDIRDAENKPLYPTYHLVNKAHLKSPYTPLPDRFDTQVIATEKLQRLAVGTDAWGDELGAFLSLWGNEGSGSLQRSMNVLSKKQRRFKDDAAIIVVKRLPKGEGYAGVR